MHSHFPMDEIHSAILSNRATKKNVKENCCVNDTRWNTKTYFHWNEKYLLCTLIAVYSNAKWIMQ